MKSEILSNLTEVELDAYAGAMGLRLPENMPRCEKVEAIVEARNRSASITVLGFTVTVPVKRLHDKRVADKASVLYMMSDAEMEKLFVDIVGQEQMDAIVEHCTDEDGTVDSDALGVFIALVLTSEELKNFESSRD